MRSGNGDLGCGGIEVKSVFKIGDYVVDQFGYVFHLTSRQDKDIVNCHGAFKRATELQIEEYHKNSDK